MNRCVLNARGPPGRFQRPGWYPAHSPIVPSASTSPRHYERDSRQLAPAGAARGATPTLPPMPPAISHSSDAEFIALQRALAGEYSLDRELGRGGMGVVYLAREVRLARPVAIKVLPPALAAHADLREAFL